MSLHSQTSDMPVVLDVRVVTGSGGGPDKTILNSPRHMTSAGYRMLCAYMHPPGDPGFEQLRRKASACDAPLISIDDRGPLDWRVIRQFLQICRREGVRIWHGHDYKSNALGLLLRRAWPMRLVSTVHGWVTDTRRTPLYYAIDRRCLARYDTVLCVSRDLQERCLASGVAARRCTLLENGIDTDAFSRTTDIGQAKLQLRFSDRPLVGAVGRLSPEKGFDVLIRAADQLMRSGVDFQLVIAGEGPHRPRLESLIGKLGRQDRIRLLGYSSDPILLYQAMDVFALSSLREALPNALLEAMALEVPVVATAVGGVPDVIRTDANGLLVAAGDTDALAGVLRRLLADESLRSRYARAGRATVERDYSFAERMRKLAAIYDQLLIRETVLT